MEVQNDFTSEGKRPSTEKQYDVWSAFSVRRKARLPLFCGWILLANP